MQVFFGLSKRFGHHYAFSGSCGLIIAPGLPDILTFDPAWYRGYNTQNVNADEVTTALIQNSYFGVFM